MFFLYGKVCILGGVNIVLQHVHVNIYTPITCTHTAIQCYMPSTACTCVQYVVHAMLGAIPRVMYSGIARNH